jgi:UDP:flavonoid glycosyltransferase YjiC (YdhE family)
MATHLNFAELVTRHGLEYSPVRGDAREILRGEHGHSLAESGHNVLRNLPAILRTFGPLVEGVMADLSAPALGEADVVVNQIPGGLFGRDLAERNGIPHITAAVMPLTLTRAFPLIFFPDALAWIPGYNELTYRLGEQMAWQPFRGRVSRWRRETLGLPAARFWGPFWGGGRRVDPILKGFSSHVVPRPPDWGEHVHVTGYWRLDESGWTPPDSLLAFLDAGPEPVFVGFGSIPVRDPLRVTGIVLDALRRTGQRGILLGGWAGLDLARPVDRVYQLDYAPYEWLFPRLRAIVHHGGSGTTGEGLRSGTPSVVVPFLMDQFYWGRRIAELGVGPPPLPFKELTAGRLAEAIDSAVSSVAMRSQVATLGEKLQAERGVAGAVGVIEGAQR